MKNTKTISLIFLLFLSLASFSQIERYVIKAENNIDRGNLKAAKEDYQTALAKMPDSRIAHLGLGLLLSELLDNYSEALPHLEKAYDPTARDTSYDLIFALAKCYHNNGEFDKAMTFYNKLNNVQDLEKEVDFQKDINKRKKDCEFASHQRDIPQNDNLYIVNAGKSINTEMPEYVPVITGRNEIIFTSKRKDSKNEELNYLDGKYFESMYLANVGPNGFSHLRRYTLPDKLLNSKFYNHHQAVVSISQDGKKLFTFKDSKLYEISLDETTYQEPGEVKIKKFDHYQNHAFLSRDGKTLYFTSDAEGGLGGTDIYKSMKTESGEWGRPENLGEPVNTAFDEDAPFIGADGTLYFASEGHEGYGNYDIYKTFFVDGKWTQPENLGQPVNSPAHDIFLVLDSTESSGYFSSARNGGFGDMDIYKIISLDKLKKDCPPQAISPLAIKVSDEDEADYRKKFELSVPKNYRILNIEWQVDNKIVNTGSATLDHDFKANGQFNVGVKYMAWCDTCLNPVITCTTLPTDLREPMPAIASNTIGSNREGTQAAPVTPTASTGEVVTTSGKKNADGRSPDNIQQKENKQQDRPVPADDDKQSDHVALNQKSPDAKKRSDPAKAELMDVELSPAQLSAIGFNSNHILFDFNKSTLRPDAVDILNTNIKVLKDQPSVYLQVYGYADSRGAKAVNERISRQRAQTVKSYLLQHGAKNSQIRFISGKGAQKFVNDCGPENNCDEAAHQQNRRVEFVVTGTIK